MAILKIFSMINYVGAAFGFLFVVGWGELFFLAPAIGALIAGVLFTAMDAVIVELKGIRAAIIDVSYETTSVSIPSPKRSRHDPLQGTETATEDEEKYIELYEQRRRNEELLSPSNK